MSESVKLQKLIADAGICSRRAAERLIDGGAVTVNGVLAKLGDRACTDDDICVNGAHIKRAPTARTYIMLNKPAGVVTTMSDESGRRCVADYLGGVGARVYPIGRLDMYSDGLLLLTDDGDFANEVSHPRGQKEKVYRVTLIGDVSDGALDALRRLDAIDINGVITPISPCGVELLSRDGGETVAAITLHEGKNRQIRRMCESVGLKISRLTRVSIGGVELGSLPSGKWRRLTQDETAALMRADDTKNDRITETEGISRDE